MIENELAAALFPPPKKTHPIPSLGEELVIDPLRYNVRPSLDDPYATEEINEDDKVMDEVPDEPYLDDSNDTDPDEEYDFGSDPDPGESDYESEPDY